LDPNSNRMLKTTFFPKLKKIAKKHKEIDTQRERAELIFELKVILKTHRNTRPNWISRDLLENRACA